MSEKNKRTPIKNGKKVIRKSGNPQWTKGVSGNPGGRPKNTEMAALRRALKYSAKKDNKGSLLRHFVERAYVDDRVLIALMKKLLPDMASTTEEQIGDLPKTFAEWIKSIRNKK